MNFMEKEKNIGVLDSGYGGLTVVKKINSVLPKESIVYLGDTARFPYGNRSEETIIDYSKHALQFLLNRNVKIIVISSHTIASISIEELKKITTIPIINIVYTGVRAAVELKPKKIGVIGSKAMISKLAYSSLIHSLNPDVKVVEKACPLLVPIIEENSEEHIIEVVLKNYLREFKGEKIDSLILGSAYFRLIKEEIIKAIGENVKLIDPYEEIGTIVKSELERIGMQTNSAGLGNQDIFLSDITTESAGIAEMFYGQRLKEIRKVCL